MLHALKERLLGLLFPDRCAGCGRVGHLFCDGCRASLRPYAQRGYLRLSAPSGQQSYLDRAAIAFSFQGALREAIHCLKYQRVRRMAQPLAGLLAQHLQCYPIDTDALVPVPLHPRRLAERGFNQSELLAQHLSTASGIPLLHRHLVRSRDTPHQVGLDAHARVENVRDAFVWQSTHSPPARVLLIDDVLTTGATLQACAQALRWAGTREVRALVLARSQ